MSLQNSISHVSPFLKLVIMGLLMLAGTGISLLIVVGFNLAFFDFQFDIINQIGPHSAPSAIIAAKTIQIASQLGMFILPAIAFAFLNSSQLKTGLKATSFPSIKTIGITIAITLLCIPFVNLLAVWNSQWHLPEALAELENWMRATQAANDKLIEVMAKMDTPTDVILNLIMMAILPAFGEELIFRGIIQPQLIKTTRNATIGIVLTALIFSGIHMQFLGFFSRAILGVIFGYLFYYSKNIWLPIIAHFTNNFLALSLVFIYGTEVSGNEFEDAYAVQSYLPAIILFAAGMYWLFRYKTKFEAAILKS